MCLTQDLCKKLLQASLRKRRDNPHLIEVADIDFVRIFEVKCLCKVLKFTIDIHHHNEKSTFNC